jgi:pimeloyl-ACP methyl ester carboxylesterase
MGRSTKGLVDSHLDTDGKPFARSGEVAAGTHAITTFHLIVSGFCQHRGQRHGLHNLFVPLHLAHASGETVVELLAWNERWRDVADDIANLAMPLDPADVRVFVYAFSWGAGWGFVQLARQLRRHRIRVECAVLSDPVYRSRWLSLSWRSLCSLSLLRPTICVPDNVEEVRWFRQKWNRPCGHDLVAEDRRRTRIRPPVELKGTPHTLMDDAYEFRELALRVARFAHAQETAA